MYDTKELFVDHKKLPAGPYEDSEVMKKLLAYYEISWKVELGEKVQVKYTVQVLPGLPVTFESS